MRLAGTFDFSCVKNPPRSLRSRPSRQREGIATLFKQTTKKLHDLHGEVNGSHKHCFMGFVIIARGLVLENPHPSPLPEGEGAETLPPAPSSSITCPECGSDLREVGITQPTKNNKGLAIALVAMLTARFTVLGNLGRMP